MSRACQNLALNNPYKSVRLSQIGVCADLKKGDLTRLDRRKACHSAVIGLPQVARVLILNQHVDVTGSTGTVEALLGEYAAGSLPIALHALMGAHLELSPANRRFVSALEASKGIELSGIVADRPIANRDARLAAIFDAPAIAPSPKRGDDVIPSAIATYIGHGFNSVPWRSRGFGFKEFHIDESDGVEASLFWVKAGRQMPSHTHDGTEITLVLKGAFSDARGHYRRGDLAVADSDVDHRPMIDPDADCICFAVTDAPLRLTGPIGRIFQRFIRH
jgi:putative transcriptional regulator